MAITGKGKRLRPVRTADDSNTIWSAITEREFRRNLVTLESLTNAVPMDVLTATIVNDEPSDTDILPLSVERSLADDLAYLAAVMEGAQSVAAVCLEQHVGVKLIVRIAGMDVVDQKVREMLAEITRVLEIAAISDNSGELRHVWEEKAFNTIIEQHSQKLLGRMRSTKWVKPTYLSRTHKKPLFRDFDNVLHRVQHIYPRKGEWKIRKVLAAVITALAREYENFENSTLAERVDELKRLIKLTYDFCKDPEVAAFASTIASINDPTPQVAAAVKTFRQLEKIGAYWRIARSLVATAMEYPASFREIELEYVMPYAEAETDIAYESWAKIMHVHAEVQLVAEYAILQQMDQHDAETMGFGRKYRIVWPRTIGTSKYLCYLCYLFLREHGEFGQALSSHGRLFDQWTVPDLAVYNSETREKFAGVLSRVNNCVEVHTEALQGAVVRRVEPMTSRQNLLGNLGPSMQESEIGIEQLTEKLSAI